MSTTGGQTVTPSSIGHHTLARLLTGWSARPGPLVTGLVEELLNLVRDGRIAAGTRLPSERALAATLSVSRNTVAAAFDELRSTGTLVSRRGAGTFVSSSGRHGSARGDERLADYAIAPAGVDTELDFRSAALPGLSIVDDAIAELGTEELQALVRSHGYLPRGLGGLRAAVADYYTSLGLPTTADQILITSGAQQALRLATSALLEPGDRVMVEDPTFRGALEVLRSAGALLIPAIARLNKLDERALRSEIATRRPAMIFLQSVVHNPLGITMTPADKRALASVSEELSIPVVDDIALLDTYIGELPPRPLAAYGGRVLTVGSASKSFWGGLRIGWLRTDTSLIGQLALMKASEDLGASVIPQLVTQNLLGKIDAARQMRNDALGEARDVCLQAVEIFLPEWRPVVPQGGASLFLKIPQGSASLFTERAARDGLLLLAGPVFSAVNGHDDYVRIPFSGSSDRVLAGVRALARAWNSMQGAEIDVDAPPVYTGVAE